MRKDSELKWQAVSIFRQQEQKPIVLWGHFLGSSKNGKEARVAGAERTRENV